MDCKWCKNKQILRRKGVMVWMISYIFTHMPDHYFFNLASVFHQKDILSYQFNGKKIQMSVS